METVLRCDFFWLPMYVWSDQRYKAFASYPLLIS